jgi:hypothetical protein
LIPDLDQRCDEELPQHVERARVISYAMACIDHALAEGQLPIPREQLE